MRKEEKFYGRGYKQLLPLYIAAAFLAVLIAVFALLRKNTAAAEWMSQNISQYIVAFSGKITSAVPFVIFEWIVILFILSALILLVLGIRILIKRKFRLFLKSVSIILIVLLSAVDLYCLSAGFIYFREPLAIPMSQTVYKNEDAVDIGTYFAKELETLNGKIRRDAQGFAVMPYDFDTLNEKLRQEYTRLDNGYFFEYTPGVKRLANSWFMSSTSYAGVSFLPLGEPSINKLMPITEQVFTAAHELAHVKGVMRENEANLTALYVLLTASDDFLRYCGYFYCYDDFERIAKMGNNDDSEFSKSVGELIPPQVHNESMLNYKYWINYKGPFDFLGDWFKNISETFNNFYLKLSGAKDGTDSYENPWTIIDTGEKDPVTGKPIIEPVYSNIHKMLFSLYENKDL